MIIAGVDEAGRGPLAGPVISAAVILKPRTHLKGLADSKVLTALQRESLFEQICRKAIAWSVGRAEVLEIDTLNIFHATMLSMKRAIEALTIRPNRVLIDGNKSPKLDKDIEVITIVDGDATEREISAASVIAKVIRDREMSLLHKLYPEYNFEKHKGYATEEHRKILKKIGPCAIHRTSFMHVKEWNEYGLHPPPHS